MDYNIKYEQPNNTCSRERINVGRMDTTTRLKTHRLLQVDIDRREQCCAANYEQVVNRMLFQVVTVEQCCNNMLTILFMVGRTTLFTPVDINLQQVVDFLNFYACTSFRGVSFYRFFYSFLGRTHFSFKRNRVQTEAY